MASSRVKKYFLMMHRLKYLIFTVLLLSTLSVAAQQSKKEEREERKRARTELRESLRDAKAATATKKGGPTEIFENPDDNFVAPENAPYLDSKAPKLYHIRKVNIHGVKYLNHDILRSASGLVPGDSVYLPGPFIQNAANRLWMQRYFEDIQIGATIEGDSLDLEVMLKERPRVMNWKVGGVPKSKSADLVTELKLKRGHELSDYVIDKNIKLIKKHFSDKGFRNCEVTASVEPDSVIKQGVNVSFDVVKNDRVRIGAITFEGNKDIESKRLERAFKKTHKVSYKFWQQTKLMEKDYEEDKELLIDFYNSKGYRNAHILSDSIYQIDNKRLGIHIALNEGNKYYIRNVNWVGNSRYETDHLQKLLAVKSGDVYDKKSIHKRLGIGKEMNPDDISITSLYQNEGYLVSQIEPAEVIVGPD